MVALAQVIIIDRDASNAPVNSMIRTMPVSGARTVPANRAPMAATVNMRGVLVNPGSRWVRPALNTRPKSAPRANRGAKIPPGTPVP